MANQIKINKTTFSVGDTVQVHQRIQEGDPSARFAESRRAGEAGKTRIQPFEGIVIAIKGSGENKMFTVRKIAAGGIGVERIWPAISPCIEKIGVKKRGKVRRAKLYYLRKRAGKKAVKIKVKKEKGLTKTSKRDEKKEPRQPRRKSRPKVLEE